MILFINVMKPRWCLLIRCRDTTCINLFSSTAPLLILTAPINVRTSRSNTFVTHTPNTVKARVNISRRLSDWQEKNIKASEHIIDKNISFSIRNNQGLRLDLPLFFLKNNLLSISTSEKNDPMLLHKSRTIICNR